MLGTSELLYKSVKMTLAMLFRSQLYQNNTYNVTTQISFKKNFFYPLSYLSDKVFFLNKEHMSSLFLLHVPVDRFKR